MLTINVIHWNVRASVIVKADDIAYSVHALDIGVPTRFCIKNSYWRRAKRKFTRLSGRRGRVPRAIHI